MQTSGGIEIIGSVPAKQLYQGELDEYTPDYTIAPLVLLPRCNATDPDAITASGMINASLTNMNWYEITNGTRKVIESSNSEYAITASGAEKGKIQVKKNIPSGQSVTLEFYAEYADPRQPGIAFKYNYFQLITCTDATQAMPSLMIDSPSGLDWNPLRDIAEQTIEARLIVADNDVSKTSKCKFFFYRLTETGGLEQVSTDGENDWEVVSLSGNQLVINRDLIGEEITYVVKASYDNSGSPSSTPDDSIDEVSTTIRRVIPSIEADWEGFPQQVPDGTSILMPKPIIRDTTGIIESPWEVLRADWYTKKSGDSAFSLSVKDDSSPSIKFSGDMLLELRVEDRGPYHLVTNGDAILTNGGNALICRAQD